MQTGIHRQASDMRVALWPHPVTLGVEKGRTLQQSVRAKSGIRFGERWEGMQSSWGEKQSYFPSVACMRTNLELRGPSQVEPRYSPIASTETRP